MKSKILSCPISLFGKLSGHFLLLLTLTLLACNKENSAEITPPEETLSSLKVGLVAHWDFLGNANDQSPGEFHGAVSGAMPAADRFGKENGAFAFNGSNDYINIGRAPALAFGGFQSYTMAAWVKPGTAGGNIVTKFNGGVLAGWYLQIKDDMHVRAYRNVGPWSTTSVDPVESDQWMHLVSKYDGKTLSIYINGVLQAQESFTSHPSDTKTDLLIGAIHSRGDITGFYEGVIDEIRLYERDLSNEERAALASHK